MSEVAAPDASAKHGTAAAHPEHEHAHPGDGRYIQIALILAVLTAIEVGTYYVELSTAALLAVLMPLMIVKFVMVARWFMHLKFDSKVFSRVFVSGLVLAVAVYTIALATFGFFSSS